MVPVVFCVSEWWPHITRVLLLWWVEGKHHALREWFQLCCVNQDYLWNKLHGNKRFSFERNTNRLFFFLLIDWVKPKERHTPTRPFMASVLVFAWLNRSFSSSCFVKAKDLEVGCGERLDNVKRIIEEIQTLIRFVVLNIVQAISLKRDEKFLMIRLASDFLLSWNW